MQQAINLSNLPFVSRWPALMPDCHEGLSVITMLCRTAKIGEIVNQMVHWNEDNSKISPPSKFPSLRRLLFKTHNPG